MKHLRTLVVLIALLWGCMVAHAEKVEIDGIWYNLMSKAKLAEVTFKGDSYDSYSNEYSGSVTIPNTVIYDDVEYSVTSIGTYAFRDCINLTSIIIPEGATSIGSNAFTSCKSLISIILPESLTSIGGAAFDGCQKLTSITIPENSQLTRIGHSTFSRCSSLTSLTIPESVTEIGEWAFSYCSSLTSVVIPENVAKIEEGAFARCSNLTSIILPENVTSIGESAFSNCSSLTSIIIPEKSKLTSIGERAFSDCNSLTAVYISDIETWCKIWFGNVATSNPLFYAHNLYLNGELVTKLVIPEGVTKVGRFAFYKCNNLISITLPSSLQSIDSEAFANCPELTDVYCYAESVPSTKTDAYDGSYPEYATLHVPTIALEGYKSTAPWSSFGTIVNLDETIASITLSESSATLTEGEFLALAIITDPENADRNLISWSSSNSNVATVDNMGKVTAVAPGTATITVTANDGSGVSASCEVTVKEKLLGKCDAPMVNYTEGKVVLTCSTEEVEYVTSVVPDNELNYQVHEFDFIPTYTFNVYATKAKYENSDVVSVTICWIDCAEEHASDDVTGMLAIPSQPVLIQSANGVITLTGLAEGTAVEIYNLNGMAQGSSTAVNGTAAITTSLEAGSTTIVKIGKRSVKVILR